MAARQLNVKNIEEINRLKGLRFSARMIARATGIHRTTIKKYLSPKEASPGVAPVIPPAAAAWTTVIAWEHVANEVRSGTPVQVLWEEQVKRGICPVSYSAFWKQLSRRHPQLPSSMHRVFAPGSRTEIDYCDGIDVLNVTTGELVKTQLFVGVLAHSRYVFAEFSYSQKSEDFLSSHVRMWEHFGGVTHVVSPDNLKSAVTRTHLYDPLINPAYTRLATHYNVAVVPARVRRPQDKGIVERTIQAFQRWFYFRIRHRSFTSIVELNRELAAHVVIFNQKMHRIFRRSRKDMWQDERQHLIPLPADPYHVAIHARAKLSADCHLVFQTNYYSAPHALRGRELDVWATATSVELFSNGERVAVHPRGRSRGKFITDRRHYPEAHQAYAEATPEWLRAQATRIGPHVEHLIVELLSGPYPLQHTRRAQGILRLKDKYSALALDRACATALRFKQFHYQFIERLAKRNATATTTNHAASATATIVRDDNPLLRGDSLFH